ncbi:PP2C family protein-serine/threonine phosphatase [Streptomyces roseolus]|uniref:PP2C family protein-serine/threonine phosphatase n=1 Tax=Streptomyces roseolus TaxID=67358 RepID=UPI001676EC2F|nr:mucin-2 [Streptomyces roseolus]GGR67498.1 hypothetical protein GCM10010282_70480 [Streptomyces roseolus]
MRPYATAQQTGTRTVQCDATAVRSAPGRGSRAFVILDGIGDHESVRSWTRTAAVQVAVAAARRADAETGLRAVYARYAAERPDGRNGMPGAAALVAVTTPDGRLTLAWAGDCRAYLITGNGRARQLTQDHNLRRVWPATESCPIAGSRHRITSYLGSSHTDQDTLDWHHHPAVESAAIDPTGPAHLLLATDGAYEPYEDAGDDIARELRGEGFGALSRTARRFTEGSVRRALLAREEAGGSPHADNATVLLARL